MMEGAEALEAEDTQALRARRLVQISGIAIIGLLLGISVYAYAGKWDVARTLSAGVVVMVLCQWLARRGLADWGNLILLVSITSVMSGLMWIAEGLHDVAFFSYPVILIMAGLLVQAWQFFALLFAMLGYMVVLTMATTKWGWRVDTPLSAPMDVLRDSTTLLVAGGVAVWISVNDLRTALQRVRLQIQKANASQKHLTYLSQHDLLTGLPNRAQGRERINQAMLQAQRNGTHVGLLFVDLDNFKAINDNLGHAAGDEYLKVVAQRLLNSVRKSDIVCRHGGDEFVVVLTDVNEAQDVSIAANDMLRQMNQPLEVKATELSVTCSIGVALYPQDASNYEDLLRKADIAMYQAKEAGRNAVCFFDEAMNANIHETLLLVSSLRHALVQNEFVLHYQPVFDLSSGVLVGAEALVRWQHPERGLVPPSEFIPASEKSGLIVELGAWVLLEACRQAVSWQSQGLHNLVMAVNLSPVQFRRGDVDKVVEQALETTGLSPAMLELEITESTLIQDTEQFLSALQKIKSLGVRLSIDDFGTGYSNLAYLQRFSVDKLKVDQSFVRRLLHGAQERAIVSAIIQMARSLNLSTTAEGIESAEEQQLLCALGCECGQGYFFARPQAAQLFLDFAVDSLRGSQKNQNR